MWKAEEGGGGYIKISRVEKSKINYISKIIDEMGGKLSQSVADIYLRDFVSYNVINQKEAKIIRAAISDKSLVNVDSQKRDYIRADIFKSILINMV